MKLKTLAKAVILTTIFTAPAFADSTNAAMTQATTNSTTMQGQSMNGNSNANDNQTGSVNTMQPSASNVGADSSQQSNSSMQSANAQPQMQQNAPVDTAANAANNSQNQMNANMGSAAGTTDNATVQQQTTATGNTQTMQNQTTSTQSAAMVPDSQIITFSQQAALATFSYDYKGYEDSLKKMQNYFTVNGWKSFNNALQETNNLSIVQKEKLTVTAEVNGESKVINHQQAGTQQQWQVQVPLKVTYKNEKNQQIIQNLLVKMAIVNDSTAPQGMGIKQYIAMPAPQEQQSS